MYKILLNDVELKVSDLDLPILIHGEDKLGASLYTITLAAILNKSNPILFLCGYKQAHEEFYMQSESPSSAKLFVKEQFQEFKDAIRVAEDNLIVIIKNIELFDDSIYDLISGRTRLILSGDINKSSAKVKIVEKNFKTKILFSNLTGYNIPELKKYTASLSRNYITELRQYWCNVRKEKPEHF